MKSFKILLTASLVVLIVSTAFAQFVAIDPTYKIPSARVLGLGKAYIGLADDSASIYTNPAGFSDASNWQITSMSGNFLDEYAYLSFSGLYPTEYGVIGAGYAGYYIGGCYATTIEGGSDPDDPVYTFDFFQPVMENRNEAMVLTYANQLEKVNYLNRMPYADRFSFGTSLKLFRTALTGDGIEAGQGLATGQELDLGVKIYPPLKWMKFGLTLQNLLPGSMGGKLVYGSGHEETYPTVFEAGSVFKMLGQEDSLFRMGQQDVKLMVDFNTYPTMSEYPLLWHIATEWKPMPLIALRVAIDQDAGGGEDGTLVTYSDLAYGVGLDLGGLNFDYAYHTFAGAPTIDNHYFSLSYGLMPLQVIESPVELAEPPDEYITFESKATIAGKVVEPAIQVLSINNIPIKFGLRGDFSESVDLKIGKNKFHVLALTEDNEKVVDAPIRVLRLIRFPDVASSYWVSKPISLLTMTNIVGGYPDGSFKPEGKVNRAEICTLLMKAKGFKPENSEETRESKFNDVSAKHWAAPYIEQAAEHGIVKGYPDGTFRPKANITRAEGLVMISRFAGISEEAYAGQFKDVNSSFWAANIISGAYKAGILDYLNDRPFQVRRKLTRAETVEMLYQTRYVQDLLGKGLLDWESY